jgi:hypothetical protein
VAANITQIKSLARAYTEKAIETLGGIMSQPGCPESARVAAATALLDRGWGKPAQAVVGGDETDNPISVIVTGVPRVSD